MHPLLAAILAGSGGGVPIVVAGSAYYDIGGDASLAFRTDGDCYTAALSGTPGALDWFKGNPSTGIGTSWEIRCRVTLGAIQIGTADTWQAITVHRVYGCQTPVSPGGNTATVEFDFRTAGGSTTAYTSPPVTFEAQNIGI